jgi:hypothetical protein
VPASALPASSRRRACQRAARARGRAGAHVTRFVALAAAGNARKAKALHALALVPAAAMAPEALAQAPADTTACPFALPGPPKRAAADDGFEQVPAAVLAAAALRMHALVCGRGGWGAPRAWTQWSA